MILSWPSPLPSYGPVVLRPFRDTDLDLVAELSSDPYLPQIGTVPAVFNEREGLAYIARQHQRLTDGVGYSFAIADVSDDRGLGFAGLWPQRTGDWATLGYAVAPSARRRGVATAALTALTAFAWTLPHLSRLVLQIEPSNTGSCRVAERCGYNRERPPTRTEIGGEPRVIVCYVCRRHYPTDENLSGGFPRGVT
jgi:RimJ/RimL family protein N-acetyltransferase